MRPDSVPLSPAQRRRERLRQHIIEVATELYRANGGADGGFELTTVESIAERADISVRSFFRYFPSKVDVIFLDKQRALEDLTALVSLRLQSEPAIPALVHASLDQVGWFLQDKINRERLHRSLLAPEFRDRLAALREQERRMLTDLIRNALHGSSGIQAQVITTTVRNVFHMALDDWAHDTAGDFLPTMNRVALSLADIVAEITAIIGEVPVAKPGSQQKKERRSARLTS